MINAYVPPDEALPAAESPIAQPDRRRLYAWLLAILAVFLGIALLISLLQNVPPITPVHDNRIEGYRQRFKCNGGEVLVVEEFASGLYKADCMARG